MTQYLPPNLLALFAPREPLRFLPPACRQPHEKKTRGYSGVAQYLDMFEDPKDTPPPTKIETREERIERKKREKAEKAAYIREQGIALWDPHNNAKGTADPYKTLFLARINPDTSESKLRREFEVYGPIRSIHMIRDKISRKPKGYAFIEFENEKDMHSAYKYGDGRKIDDRRVLVDVERGRTVKGWLPRRLGGGLGSSSRAKDEENGNGDRGGYRDRDRNERERERSRDRDRDRRKRDRERERERSDRGDRGDRGDRRKRDRERRSMSSESRSERKRRRS